MLKVISAIWLMVVIMASLCQAAQACQVDQFLLTKEGSLAASTPEVLLNAIKVDAEGNSEEIGRLIKHGAILRLTDNVKVEVLERSVKFKMLKIKFLDKKDPFWVKDGSLKSLVPSRRED